MRLLICADAQPDIGTGHVRRMLTLAGALQGCGVSPALQTSRLGIEIARTADIDIDLIEAPCFPDVVRQTLASHAFSGVVLDNYHWARPTETPLRDHTGWIAVIDDLADRPHDADVLLDQNAHHSAADYDPYLAPECLRLVGPQWCLLSSQFQTQRVKDHDAGSLGRDAPILVSLGGGDPHRDLARITQCLLDGTALPLIVVTGSHIADADRLRALASTYPDRLQLAFDSQDVAGLMMACQFAVSAGGTMAWERAAVGLPSLCLIVADNQAESARWLKQHDLHDTFDLRGSWAEADLLQAVAALAADPERRQLYTRNARRLIPTDGAVRTARALVESLRTRTC